VLAAQRKPAKNDPAEAAAAASESQPSHAPRTRAAHRNRMALQPAKNPAKTGIK